MGRKTLLSWSSGKDSAWTLQRLRQDSDYELVGLFSTVNREADRVAMHGVRIELLKMQAESVGLPLTLIELPFPCSNDQYVAIMDRFFAEAKADGVEAIAFGDLFLEDIRSYRETHLEGSGLEPIFPIWGIPTETLANEMIESGVKAIATCIDPKQVTRTMAGQQFGPDFLAQLPASADKCGENGEFHTFVYDGPMFEEQIEVRVGEVVERGGFVFADVLPAGSPQTSQ